MRGLALTGLGVLFHSEIANDKTFGVLRLTLHPAGYNREFVPVAGKSFTDSGSGSCHP